MVRKLAFVTLALVAAGIATYTRAGAEDRKTKGDQAAVVVLATTIDFAADLDLDFAGLKGLGARIELARTAADPVSLAVAAAELGAAEKASGKMARVTSAELLKEAVDQAKRRYKPAELAAIATLVTDEGTKKALTELAVAAKDKEKEGKRGIGG